MKLLRDRTVRRSRLSLLLGLGVIAALAFAGSSLAALPVNLGTADSFAILAGNTITDVPTSTIRGNVGLSPATGSAIGLTCAQVVGTIYEVDAAGAPCFVTSPGLLTTAKTSVTTAYNNAAGQTPTPVADELAGQTLTTGVYNSASGVFGMTGTLVLDGENNANAIFIFQTASTLTTGGTGNVSLIRGAQACNVFWQVGSAATLGAGSTFRGTILAHDDISLDNGVTVDGRLLAGAQASGAGAVTLINDTITRSGCAAATTAPPTASPTVQAPDRELYCDPAGTAYNLVIGQNTQAPYDTLGLVPAYVDPVTGSKSCNFPVAASAPTPTPTTLPTPTPATTPTPSARATKAAAAVKAAAAKARAARVRAAKARAAKVLAAKRLAAATSTGSSSTQTGHARPPRRHAGFTG